jgi:hypothetical protein
LGSNCCSAIGIVKRRCARNSWIERLVPNQNRTGAPRCGLFHSHHRKYWVTSSPVLVSIKLRVGSLRSCSLRQDVHDDMHRRLCCSFPVLCVEFWNTICLPWQRRLLRIGGHRIINETRLVSCIFFQLQKQLWNRENIYHHAGELQRQFSHSRRRRAEFKLSAKISQIFLLSRD